MSAFKLQVDARAKRYEHLAKAWENRGDGVAAKRARLLARLLRSGLEQIEDESWEALGARLDRLEPTP